MHLSEWVRLHGYGEMSRLAAATGLGYQTIHELVNTSRTARGETAARISKATGGAVTVAELVVKRRGARKAKRLVKLKRKAETRAAAHG